MQLVLTALRRAPLQGMLLAVALVALCLAPSAAMAVDVSDIERAEVTRINDYRRANGLGVVEIDQTLTATAEWHGADMTSGNYFSHTDSLGRDPFQRLAAFGYPGDTWRGENLAAGNADVAATFEQWRTSPPHNENMLNANFKAIGIARVYGESSTYKYYWVTTFGSRVVKAVPDSAYAAQFTAAEKTKVKNRMKRCMRLKPGSAKYKALRCGYYLKVARKLGYR